MSQRSRSPEPTLPASRRPAVRSGPWTLTLVLALAASACGDATKAASESGGARVVVDRPTSPAPDQWRVRIKRLAASDAGTAARQLTDRTVAVDGAEFRVDGFDLSAALLPAGEGPMFLHAVGLAGDTPLVVADGPLGETAGADIEIVAWTYDAACDLDGDTFRDCTNVAAACCTTIAMGARSELGDCLDDPGAVMTPEVPDRKLRDAAQVSPFESTESPEDYQRCDNQLDDDCAGGDAPCARIDADEDGFDLTEDCDDANPDVHPGAADPPYDDLDQDCDGRDAEGTDGDGDGYTVDDPAAGKVDCDDHDGAVHPGAGEVSCDGIDQDCDGADVCLSDGEARDLDGDGVEAPEDCDDHDAGRRPGLVERCGDAIDQDCDGVDAACAPDDGDKDGYGAGVDCDDTNPEVHPDAPERCGDAVDQDCDSVAPTCADAVDADGDTWPAPGDCDDRDAAVHPGAEERCDNRDNDCDGVVDEGNPRLFGDEAAPHPETCGRDEAGCHVGPLVCAHDAQGGVFDLCLGDLGSPEVCDGFDNDCDGLTDALPGEGALAEEGVTPCGPELERGACKRGLLFCAGGALSECRGAVTPSDERCNGLDDDCDGQTDNGPGGTAVFESCYGAEAATRDVGECRVGIRRCVDGVFLACEGEVLPLPEICDGLDNDCDGVVDNGASAPCWDFDPAARGVGACRDGQRACVDGVLGDCEGQLGPSPEVCDGVDNDCDGAIDAFTEACYGGDPATLGRNRPCRSGLRACDAGRFGPCVGEVLPRVEQCDDQDDDCDGVADDDFDLSTDAMNCGRCGAACAAGESCCGGRCAAIDTAQNCGGCGVICDRSSDGCVVGPGGAAACACGGGPACAAGLRCNNGTCGCQFDDDCGPDALCCGGRCEPTSAGPGGQCGACGDGGCDPAVAQRCDRRECRCGENEACQAGHTFCGERNGAFVCQGCVTDGDCGDGERCCQGVCAPTDADTQCEACGQACDPVRADTCAASRAGAEQTFECVCGDTGAACDPAGPTPFCVGGACVPCRVDADCGVAGNGQCVANVCQACDPADHAGCGEQQLCCAGVCQATGGAAGQSCTGCGVSCDAATTNGCGFRTCHCGDGPACSGATPVCDDARGVCVGCNNDGDCAGNPAGGQCVDHVCRVCDPNGHDGCGAQQICCAGGGAGAVRCEATGAGAGDQCEACDVACDARTTGACVGRACGCGDGPACGGNTPICDDIAGRCVECTGDPDCAGRPGGGQCVANVCRPCDPADHAGCAGDQLCCDFTCRATSGAAGQSCERCGQACGDNADTCRNRTCVCGAANQACAGGGICSGGQCGECVDNSQCAANELCCGQMCVPTGGGAGDVCQACGQACNAGNSNRCDGRTCRCGNGAACGGGTPVCDDAAGRCVECLADADCAGRPGGGQCVANQCRACDPGDHAGCNATQLCCNYQCEATSAAMNQQCQACDQACPQDPTNTCNNRTCGCGNGAACGGNTPYCNDGSGQCVACRSDNDCSNGAPECVGGTCRTCDPSNDAGCGRQVCGNDFACHRCQRDSDCNDNPNGNNCHNDGTCHH